MRNPYYPEKIKACLLAVKAEHRTLGALLDDNSSEVDFVNTLKKIEKMTESEVAAEALVMRSAVKYLCNN